MFLFLVVFVRKDIINFSSSGVNASACLFSSFLIDCCVLRALFLASVCRALQGYSGYSGALKPVLRRVLGVLGVGKGGTCAAPGTQGFAGYSKGTQGVLRRVLEGYSRLCCAGY